MPKPYISGFFTLAEATIFLEDVRGIYADRGNPRKPGYWIKLKCVDSPKGIRKIYCEGLTQNERIILEAAGRFNQVVDAYCV